ncbi:hypothetical protein GCM10025857_33880 [Alicyclobacillus contaminans]|uniref:hypothetical protein n=1 Tax=Alicyclobacillus contaminans TaxID=392016 RepID=UPI0003F4B55B|nr:hypothetical protein [Alicyclobacillus contaminans]GMA52031.1 hypothetical protein GCM10025857_33880 [Alicyclobacillus contaminans]
MTDLETQDICRVQIPAVPTVSSVVATLESLVRQLQRYDHTRRVTRIRMHPEDRSIRITLAPVREVDTE